MIICLYDKNDVDVKNKKRFNPVRITINNMGEKNTEHIAYAIKNTAMIDLLLFLLIEETDVGHIYFNENVSIHKYDAYDNDDIYPCKYFDYFIYPEQINKIFTFLNNDPKTGLEKLKNKIEILDDSRSNRLTKGIYYDCHLRSISQSDLEILSSQLFTMLTMTYINSARFSYKDVSKIHFRVFL